MTLDTFTILARYTQKANETMNGIIASLSKEEWQKPFTGYFKTVQELCSHIFVADFVWLKRFGSLRVFPVLQDPYFQEALGFQHVYFDDKAEYLKKRSELDEKLVRFVGELSDQDLESVLRYSNSEGKVFEKNFGALLLHAFNHGTHHRGMISLYLEMLGKANDYNSLSAVL